MEIIDITVPISRATPIFPGDPRIEIQQWAAIERGDAANVTMLHFGAHTATHVDAPAHFIAGGSRVESMPLGSLIGHALVVEVPEGAKSITVQHLTESWIEGTERVLFKTTNSFFWADAGSGFRTDFVYIEPETAKALVDRGVKLVGIDYLSVERYHSGSYETHITLLANGVVIVEGLDLRNVTPGEYEFICLPLKIAEGTGDGAPARAVLRTLDKTWRFSF
jgi:arylformamidase